MGDLCEGFDLLFNGDKPRSTKRIRDSVHYIFGDVSNIIAEYVGVCVPSNLSLDTLCTKDGAYLCYKDLLDIKLPILSNDNKMCMEDIILGLSDAFGVGFRMNSTYNFVDINISVIFILDNIDNTGYDKFKMHFVRPKSNIPKISNHQFILYNYANLHYDTVQRICNELCKPSGKLLSLLPNTFNYFNINTNTKLLCIIYEMMCVKFKNISKCDIRFNLDLYRESKHWNNDSHNHYYISVKVPFNISKEVDDGIIYPLDKYITKLFNLIDNTKNYISYEIKKYGDYKYPDNVLPIFYHN